MENLAELLSRTTTILRSYGYSIERVTYPEDPMKRSIDIVAVSSPRHVLLVKVVEDADMLSVSELRELRSCSRLLRGRGIIVTEKIDGVKIDDIVAHEKMGTYAVSVEGLRAALESSIYVVHRQGNYYMRVDGEKLRQKRLEQGYSLGDVASQLSVSRRSVYMYEQEGSMVSLNVAVKLMEIFSEEIFKPIDILDYEEERKQPLGGRHGSRSKTAHRIRELGYEVVETRHVPLDILAARDDSRLMIVIERRREKDIERRIEETERVANHVEALVISIVSDEAKSIARKYNVYIASNIDEAIDVIAEVTRVEHTAGDRDPSPDIKG